MEIAKGISLLCGDMREVLATLPEASVDSCVCDPPYHLASIVKRMSKPDAAPVGFGGDGRFQRMSRGFMGKEWDGGEIAFEPETWAAVYRVLKPGAHLLAFGAPKNFGFMQYAIAQAGFEIRDVIAWLFGSGFPKSHNIGDGWGTALKPAYEPIVMARKPLIGTVAQNVAEHGTGAINVDGCRVPGEPIKIGMSLAHRGGKYTAGTGGRGTTEERVETAGRWPANVVHDGSEEVLAAFPDAPGQLADISTTAPSSKTGHIYGKMNREGEASASRRYSERGSTDFAALPGQRRDDSGSAARFFYTAKADSNDRIGSKHPTVKPVDLMQWLVRMVTPKSGIVLDPFAGTGTTGEAAFREGMRAVLIEREPEYQDDIRRRMKLALAGPDERQRESIKARGLTADAGPLFGGSAEAAE